MIRLTRGLRKMSRQNRACRSGVNGVRKEISPRLRSTNSAKCASLGVLALILSALSLSFPNGVQAQETLVSRAAFAGGVASQSPMPEYRPGQKVAPGSLWFWTELSVSKDGLADLRQRKLLPLQHRWYRSYGGVPATDTPPDFFRNLEELDDRKIEALATEANSRGYFTYRTASCRQSIPQGDWVIIVTDANGTPVRCKGKDVCRFSITVARSGVVTSNKCLGN